MASAWGLAWNQAWGDAWGVVGGEGPPEPPQPPPQVDTGPPPPSGGYPSGDRGPSAEQVRRSRIAHGIIREVAARQASDLHLDAIQRRQELEGELRLRGIELEIAHYEELNRRRQALIDAEIAARLRAIMEDDEAALAIIMAASI